MTDLEPTQELISEARRQVASRGWAPSTAAHHPARPNAIQEDDGQYRACEYCHAKRNRARWPLFFRRGPNAGRLLWTCSTCKLAHADERDEAVVLVETPEA